MALMDSSDSVLDLEATSSEDLDEEQRIDSKGAGPAPAPAPEFGQGATGRELRELNYQTKFADLLQQLVLLEARTHPDYTRRLEEIEAARDERLSLNECVRNFETSLAIGTFREETEAAEQDFGHQERMLRQKLVADQEKSLQVNAADRLGLRLMDADDGEERCIPTRNLRRKINDPSGPGSDKRLKPNRFPFSLDEGEINEDLKAIYKSKF